MKLITLLLLSCLGVSAQNTDRKITLKNSADGESELTIYLPTAEKATGRAIVGCPGGGYTHLSMDNEGHNWAEFYNSQGIAYAVLKYRMPKGDRNIPLGDAYNAIRTVRDSADVWHINRSDVGIQGFSAGGHLASAVSTHAPLEVRPDFSILFYPVISMNERETHKGSCVGFLGDNRNDPALQGQWSSDKAVRRHLTPPALILMSSDDNAVPVLTNGIAYYSAMRRAGNNCAMMVYPSGGHGWGFKSTFTYHEQMKQDLTNWLNTLPSPSPKAVRVACIGNSITDGHGIDMCDVKGYPAILGRTLGKDYQVKNFGVSGRTALNKGDHPYQKEMAWQDCKAWNPDIAVIKLGTNDSKTAHQPFLATDFTNDMQQIIDSLKARNNKVRIVIAEPIPAFSDSWTISDSVITSQIIPMLETIAKKNNAELLDLHTPFLGQQELIQRDDIHPNDKGVAKIAQLVAEQLKKPAPAPITNKKNSRKKK